MIDYARATPARREGRVAAHAFEASILGLVVALLSSAGAGASSGPVRRVGLAFEPGPRAAAQGTPLAFAAVLTSSSSEPVKATVLFSVTQRGGRSIPFLREVILLPAKGRQRVSGTVSPAQWFRKTGLFEIVGKVEGGRASARLKFTLRAAPVLVPRFQDVTRRAGLVTAIPDGTCGHWTNGAAWGDVDGNGFADLYVTRGPKPAQLFVNGGHGRFREQAARWGVADTGAYGAVFVDFDRDGRLDLYVARDGPNRLYRSLGARFADIAESTGVADPGNSVGSAWADYDGDGRLDVVVSNYARCKGETLSGGLEYGVSRLYHQEGDRRFSDRTALIGSSQAATFQAAWFDMFADGRPDLYIGNDYVGQRPDANYLWRNDGPAGGGWLFTDTTVSSGTAFAMNTMGIAVGDYNRDAELDLALSNIEANRLLRSIGSGRFVDVGVGAGVGRPQQRVDQKSVTWGAVFADFNLDGWEDLYFAAGALVDYDEKLSDDPQRNELFVNRRDGTFLDLSAPSRSDDPGQSRGVAVADYDRDGRLDLYVVNQKGIPRLFHNVTPRRRNHWLAVELVGTRSNRDGCGARVSLELAGPPLVRELTCGSTSISSGGETVAHFGLGRVGRLTEVVIEWPSGARQVLRNVRADRFLRVTEPRR